MPFIVILHCKNLIRNLSKHVILLRMQFLMEKLITLLIKSLASFLQERCSYTITFHAILKHHPIWLHIIITHHKVRTLSYLIPVFVRQQSVPITDLCRNPMRIDRGLDTHTRALDSQEKPAVPFNHFPITIAVITARFIGRN